MRLIGLVWGATLYSCVGAFIVPDQLVSLLTVVYSVIPPIKKGSDSRVGFGYRFGPFADFQVLLELGPQTETRPIDGQTPASIKREVDPAKSNDIQVLDGPDPPPAPPPQVASSRSARSRPAPVAVPSPAAPAAPAAPPPGARSDWLSRWRSSISGAPAGRAAPDAEPSAPLPPPQAAPRLYSVGSRPRPARAPAFAAPTYTAPAATQQSPMSQEERWEAMRRLRSLYWAGQQG